MENVKRKSFINKQSKNEIPKLRRKLRIHFHEFIRLRDKDNGCISCVTGGVHNAGHFRSVGSSPQASMAFDEKNVNGQCVRCNYTLGGNPDGYKKGLVRKYGPKILEEIEIKKSMRQNPWTKFEYETMIKHYQEKVKEIKDEN